MGVELKEGVWVVALLLLLASAYAQDASAVHSQDTSDMDDLSVTPNKQAEANKQQDGERIGANMAYDSYDSYEAAPQGYGHPQEYANGCPQQLYEQVHHKHRHHHPDGHVYAKPIGQDYCPSVIDKDPGSRSTYGPYDAYTQEHTDQATTTEEHEAEPRCPYGLTECRDVCTNLDCDDYNCGGCGVVCQPNAACIAGICRCDGLDINSKSCAKDCDCCNAHCVDGFCCAPGKRGLNETCLDDSQCCTFNCNPDIGNKCDFPVCFSAASMVNIEESSAPVSMRELRTGQHVECLDSGDDMMTPTTKKWCEVINFIHADDAVIQQQRISFTRPDGTHGSITLAQTHLVYKLTAQAAQRSIGVQASNVNDFGAFELVPAVNVRHGDTVVVTLKKGAGEAHFAGVPVTGVETVSAQGLYLPVIEEPYIVVDGVVMPLWTSIKPPLIRQGARSTTGDYTAHNALLHSAFSPLFMQRLQPIGTPGKQAQWDGRGLWPGVYKLTERINANPGAAVDFDAVQRLFIPKYAAWKAARAAPGSNSRAVEPAITPEQVLDVVGRVLVRDRV